MKTTVILQPSYLPWLGYFEQIYRSDIFVFYDDAQFDKNGWRNRNRIKTKDGVQWLTVPVKVSLGDKIKDVRIDNSSKWYQKHLKTVELAYKKAKFFEENFKILEKILSQHWDYLVDLDVTLIKEINKILGMGKNLIYSSQIGVREGGSTSRLVNICSKLGADTFYEGASGRDYIIAEEFKKAKIKLVYQNYKHPVYTQLYGDFLSHLSIIDLIFNEGPNSLKILTNNYAKLS